MTTDRKTLHQQGLGLDVVSRDLTARAADVVVRIAGLLDVACTEESGGAAAAEFLHAYAESSTTSRLVGRQLMPLDRLADRFELTEDEVTLLLLAGVAEEHEGLASTFRALHPRGEPRPTVGLGCRLLADNLGRASVRKILVEGAAIRFGLIRLTDGPFPEQSITLGDGLWESFHGLEAWPASVERFELASAAAGLDSWLALPEVQRCRQALLSSDRRTVLVPSSDERIAASRVAAVARGIGSATVGARIDPQDRTGIALVLAHAACRGAVAVLFVRHPVESGSIAFELDLDDLPGPVVVCAAPGSIRAVGLRPVVTMPLGPIGTDARREAWRKALPDMAEQSDNLAARHPLDPAITSEVASDVRSKQRLGGGLTGLREISDTIRARAGMMLPFGVSLDSRIVGWDRLALEGESLAMLRDAVDRLRFQSTVLDDWGFLDYARASRGVRLLFTGPPGTGKSLTAEVVATAAGTDLLVVDVSQVVSKWIGETEKNLANIFDAAERMQAVLLLDEADSLFTTRTEVNDAHDRYANLQTAYLLQRLERFEGLAVLTTNLRQNIDPAFMRRIDYVIEFAMPDVDLRRRLWDLHLPTSAPIETDLDTLLLAEMFAVPGAWIRNAAIGGAFLAAAEEVELSTEHVIKAMTREYGKAARPLPRHPELDLRVATVGIDPVGSERPSTLQERQS